MKSAIASQQQNNLNSITYTLRGKIAPIPTAGAKDFKGLVEFQLAPFSLRGTLGGQADFFPEFRLCCTNPVWDSSRDSSVVAGVSIHKV